MVVQWKRISSIEYAALWQNKNLSLQFQPDHAGAAPWLVFVDGVLVTHYRGQIAKWWSSKAAIDAVDSAVNRIIINSGHAVHAVQKPLTPRRIHGAAAAC